MSELLLSAALAWNVASSEPVQELTPTSPYIMQWAVRSSPYYRYKSADYGPRKTFRGGFKPTAKKSSSHRASTIRERRRIRAIDYGMEVEKIKPRKTLIISPHPDDEIICCADLMRARLTEGESIRIIYLTDGDALNVYDGEESREYGRTRRAESLRAMAKIGIPKSNLVFLNFPDASLGALDHDTFTSPYTHQHRSLTATHFNHTPYTRENLERNLKRLIHQYDPDEIYLPSTTKDRHPDHISASQLVQEILPQIKHQDPKVFAYIVHNHKRLKNLAEVNIWKLHLLRIFTSQFHDAWHQNFMEAFARIPETFELINQEVTKD